MIITNQIFYNYQLFYYQKINIFKKIYKLQINELKLLKVKKKFGKIVQLLIKINKNEIYAIIIVN